MVGNILHKGPRGQNSRVIAYGMEGIKHDRNALYVVNNTMVYEYRRPSACLRPRGASPRRTSCRSSATTCASARSR